MNLRHQIEHQYSLIQMKSHFKFSQKQNHHYTSSQTFLSKYKSSLSQFDKLYHHIDSFLECLEAKTRQELSRKRIFPTNYSKSKVII